MYNSITEILLDKAGTTNTDPCPAEVFSANSLMMPQYAFLFDIVKYPYKLK